MWLLIMEAVGVVTKTAKGFFGDSGVSIDNWTFKFFYKVMYYFAFQINVNEIFVEPIMFRHLSRIFEVKLLSLCKCVFLCELISTLIIIN